MKLKMLFVLIPAQVFGVEASANTPCEDNWVELNYVNSVKVNGLKWQGLRTSISMPQFRKAFGTKDIKLAPCSIDENGVFDCNGVYDALTVAVHYPNRTVTLVFPFDYENFVQAINNLAKGNFQEPFPNPTSFQVSWDDMTQFKDALVVDGRPIRSNMTFNTFRSIFPLSAQWIHKEQQDMTDEKWYVVGAEAMTYPDDLPHFYNTGWCTQAAIFFQFKNNKIQLRHSQPAD